MSNFQEPKGVNFATTDDVGGADISEALRKVVAFVQSQSPYIELERYDDWWEHDGLHFYRSPISLDELFSIVHSPRSLLESMPGDFQVSVGIYAKDIPFYLRFYVDWNDDETEVIGRFDVTFPEETANRFRREMDSTSKVEFQEKPSEDYYRSIIQ
jgi:hypothetical protein